MRDPQNEPPTAVSTWKRALQWVDEFGLFALAGFLLAFIPLYPKIPLFSPIEQYIVRVRLEDIILLITAIWWGVQVLRRKVNFRSPITGLICAYAVVGLLSLISAGWIIHTIPIQPLHLGKSFLHYFRYLEYFSLFFIVFSALKKRSQVWTILAVFAMTIIGISVYGYGQKFYYWPVYSTMNREFSKGVRLYLTPHARVQSTFAGHYDMAAFLVVALPIILAVWYQLKGRKQRLFFGAAYWIGTWLIIVSASRTSFLAFVSGMLAVIFFTGIRQTQWWRMLWFWVSRGALMVGVTGMMFMVFGEDLQERLSQVLSSNPVVYAQFHELNKQRKDLILKLTGQYATAPTPPPNSISTDDAITSGVLTPTDTLPEPVKPVDTYDTDVPEPVLIATSSDPSIPPVLQYRERVWSPCAQEKGLSLCIRLETLWPRAIKGFLRNPLLGSGYATLNKDAVEQFTEAESTDNNFLRTLGETGLLGFITFYGCVAVICWYAVRSLRSKDELSVALSVGVLGASIGLLLNAIYIDVFAASKVALTYWGFAGVFFAQRALSRTTANVDSVKPLRVLPNLSPLKDVPSLKLTPAKARTPKRSTKKSRRR